ncbi:MAG: hypothetical protein KF740_12945 [Ramlibacter sp.]|nr:hypothetical protein [Ramlibacter sp.]
MATPNYGYEKRQKELAKKRKKEDKLKAKAERKSGQSTEGSELPADGEGMDDDASANPASPPDTAAP